MNAASIRKRPVQTARSLLGIWLVSALLSAYMVWPILLWPFADVLVRSPLAGLLGLIPCLFIRARPPEEGRSSLPALLLADWKDALFAGANLGAVHVLVQILLIKMKTHLTLDQYIREYVYVVWIVMMVLGVAYGFLLLAWGKSRD